MKILDLAHLLHDNAVFFLRDFIQVRHKNFLITQFLRFRNPLFNLRDRTNLATQPNFSGETEMFRDRNIFIRRKN